MIGQGLRRYCGERLGRALRRGTAELKESTSAQLDARVLMKLATGVDDVRLILEEGRMLTDEEAIGFAALVDRRAAGEPVAYIAGEKEFRGQPFECRAPVLCPRPDTETLIELAEEVFSTVPPTNILDLGCGSGVLLITALTIWSDAVGVGVDRSEAAADLSRRNAARLGVANRARIVHGDWREVRAAFSAFPPAGTAFDLILSNPPYIRSVDAATLPRDVVDHEDPGALFAGEDGLAAYREVADVAAGMLAAGGALIVELGEGQRRAVQEIVAVRFPEAHIRTQRDLAGIERALVVVLNGARKPLQ